ncbi:hypothetical protein QOT17_021795 [Balamuthia mandrillaris]
MEPNPRSRDGSPRQAKESDGVEGTCEEPLVVVAANRKRSGSNQKTNEPGGNAPKSGSSSPAPRTKSNSDNKANYKPERRKKRGSSSIVNSNASTSSSSGAEGEQGKPLGQDAAKEEKSSSRESERTPNFVGSGGSSMIVAQRKRSNNGPADESDVQSFLAQRSAMYAHSRSLSSSHSSSDEREHSKQERKEQKETAEAVEETEAAIADEQDKKDEGEKEGGKSKSFFSTLSKKGGSMRRKSSEPTASSRTSTKAERKKRKSTVPTSYHKEKDKEKERGKDRSSASLSSSSSPSSKSMAKMVRHGTGTLFRRSLKGVASSSNAEAVVAEGNDNIGVPMMVKHKSHVGLDSQRGFEIRNLPPEWSTFFEQINHTLKSLGETTLTGEEVKLLLTSGMDDLPQGLPSIVMPSSLPTAEAANNEANVAAGEEGDANGNKTRLRPPPANLLGTFPSSATRQDRSASEAIDASAAAAAANDPLQRPQTSRGSIRERRERHREWRYSMALPSSPVPSPSPSLSSSSSNIPLQPYSPSLLNSEHKQQHQAAFVGSELPSSSSSTLPSLSSSASATSSSLSPASSASSSPSSSFIGVNMAKHRPTRKVPPRPTDNVASTPSAQLQPQQGALSPLSSSTAISSPTVASTTVSAANPGTC